MQSHAFVSEISDHNPLPSRAVIVAGIYAHARARCACFAKGHAGGHRLICKSTVAVVLVELIWLSVVGNEEIHPTVAVVVEQCDPERFAGGIVESSALCDVFKSAVTPVVI